MNYLGALSALYWHKKLSPAVPRLVPGVLDAVNPPSQKSVQERSPEIYRAMPEGRPLVGAKSLQWRLFGPFLAFLG